MRLKADWAGCESSCNACGQVCQTRCYAINVKEKHLLSQSAIIIHAGEGKEDRLMNGSYLALRERERATKRSKNEAVGGNGYFIPDTDKPQESPSQVPGDEDPFGIENSAEPVGVESMDDPFGLNE